jgi:hypothetical protein
LLELVRYVHLWFPARRKGPGCFQGRHYFLTAQPVYPNVAKVEDARDPRRPRVRLSRFIGTPNPWQQRTWGILGFPIG